MQRPNHIVIIEDDETFSLLVMHYLKSNLSGAKVYRINRGAHALDRLSDLRPNLIILDYFLEDKLSAVDVLHHLEAFDPRPLVVMLSSLKDEEEKKRMLEMGVDRFIPKSNESFYDLVKTIEELLQIDAIESNRFVIGNFLRRYWWVFLLIVLTAALFLAMLYQG